MRLGSFLFGFFLAAAPLLSQALQQPGSVSGKVINSVTGQAVKKAVVTLRGGSGQNSYVTGSDQSGKFQFDNVQPDKYLATAECEGYSGTPRSTQKLIPVAAQQEVSDLEVRVAPLSIISGKVLDENGQPLEEASVTALRYDYSGGGKTLQSVGQAQTNDRGEYRIYDLQPGRYYLMASASRRNLAMQSLEVAMQNMAVTLQGRPASGPVRFPQENRIHSTIPEEGYAAVFYPGVANISQASSQELKPGAEWSGADFKMRQLPTYHIRGHVTGAAARTGGRNMVHAEPCEADETAQFLGMPSSLQVSQQADARFDASGAVPGTYCVSVMQPGARAMAGKQVVTVKAGDVDDVELQVPTSFAVGGTLVIDGTPPNPMPQLFIGLRTVANQGVSQVAIKGDGAFQIDGMYPGAYTIVLPQGWLYPKSILYGSQDVTNGVIPNLQAGIALTITMGTDPGEVDGTVQPGAVEPGVPVSIATVPDGANAARQDMERFASTPAGANYTMPNLPPGDYKIFALESDDFGDLRNRDLLKLLEGKASAATVHAGEHVQVGVTAISAGEVEQAKGKLK